MLIPLHEILTKYNIRPKGVIHVGAHWGEEYEEYKSNGIENIVWIEPCKEAWSILCTRIEDEKCMAFHVACGAEERTMPMYVSHQNQGQSNSLLRPNLHLQQHPEIIFDDAEVVKVVTLDSLPLEKEKYDMLAMDVQGFEGEVIKGASETLKHIDIIYTECNRGETYDGNMLIEDIELLLSDFKRVETHWPSPNWTWGDCILIRKTLLNA